MPVTTTALRPRFSAATASSPGHTVRRGETLSGIAQAKGVSLQALIEANPQIQDPNLIRPGQTLQMPAGSRAQAGGAAAEAPAATGRTPPAASTQQNARARAAASEGLAAARVAPQTTTPDPSRADVEAGKAQFQLGQQGPFVQELQKRLSGAGYGVQPTSRFGPTTEAVVKQLQQAQGVQQTGQVGKTTLEALDRAELEAVRQGKLSLGAQSTGGAVRSVQQKLGVEPTGVFGETTKGAVQKFQQERGLSPDGVVGPATLAALEGKNTPAPAAGSTPRIDQNALPHERGWAFCGVASALMVRGQQGQSPALNRSTLDAAARDMYITGQGTSGAGMANYLSKHGIASKYTTTGTTADLVSALQRGRSVPVGVDSFGGNITGMDGRSARYPGLGVGDRYRHSYGASGHWVVVTGFQGDPANPSGYTVNDPNTGATVQLSRAEFDRHAATRNGLWMVGPR